ncbi:putative EG45-like domain containing protein [Iris pallida]|uniref:EG45-like domain containing protein n=1 Tax=Iris pallida TaxID=29817 RepID=A0AAX6I783_IRIPA|nr:putative EG45-like domain containing protein [Iris pallida]
MGQNLCFWKGKRREGRRKGALTLRSPVGRSPARWRTATRAGGESVVHDCSGGGRGGQGVSRPEKMIGGGGYFGAGGDLDTEVRALRGRAVAH